MNPGKGLGFKSYDKKKKKKKCWKISNQRGHIKFSKNYGSCREGNELQGSGSTEN